MGENSINNNISAVGIKQYYVSGANGSSMVRVAFDPQSSATSRISSGSGSGVMISIGTKNLTSSAAITNAINKAVNSVTPQSAEALVKESAENIMNSPEEAVMAASMTIPNEELVGLLM